MNANAKALKYINRGRLPFASGEEWTKWFKNSLALIQTYELDNRLVMVTSCINNLIKTLEYQKKHQPQAYEGVFFLFAGEFTNECRAVTPAIVLERVVDPIISTFESEKLRNIVTTETKPRARVNLL